VPFNAIAQNEALKSGTGGGIAGIITHVGINTLVTAPPTDTTPGTGTNAAATEATGGSPAYARVAVTWGTPASGVVANTGALTFDVPAGTYGFFTYWNASTGNSNNFRGYAVFGGASPKKGFGTVDSADLTANTIGSNGHGLVNTDRVILFNVVGETIPGGLTEGGAYFVVGATTDTFQVSLTSGGAAVDLVTTQGEVYFEKVVPEVFAGQGQITAAIGALTLDASAI
jgi:hypothetical protein